MSSELRLAPDTLNVASRAALHDLIHDRWFDLERTRLDEDRHLYVIPFGEKKRGPYNRRLEFGGAVQVRIVDEARIQLYDIDRVEVDAEGSTITLHSGFPLRLLVSVGPDWEITVR